MTAKKGYAKKGQSRKAVKQQVKATAIDEATGKPIIVAEPHVLIPVRQLSAGMKVSRDWNSTHFPGCWESHGSCAINRVNALFAAGTAVASMFQVLPLPLEHAGPQTRHLYAKAMSEFMAELARTSYPEMNFKPTPDGESDQEVRPRKTFEELTAEVRKHLDDDDDKD